MSIKLTSFLVATSPANHNFKAAAAFDVQEANKKVCFMGSQSKRKEVLPDNKGRTKRKQEEEAYLGDQIFSFPLLRSFSTSRA